MLTTMKIATFEDAMELSKHYGVRWSNELYHKVLKSGCGIEKLQLRCGKRIERCIPLYSVIAWRIMYLTMLGRECPELDCSELFEELEWKVLVYAAYGEEEGLERERNVGELVKVLGRLGGHVGRKGDKEPGFLVLSRGMEKAQEILRLIPIILKLLKE